MLAGSTMARADGRGSVESPDARTRLCRVLLLGACIAALTPSAALANPGDSCTVSADGLTLTCTGDLGFLEAWDYDHLIVQSLTSSIGTPAHPLFLEGIKLDAFVAREPDGSAVTADIDTTGTAGVFVSDTDGISIENAGSGSTTVTSKGAISVVAEDFGSYAGIYVEGGAGDIRLTSSSDITVSTIGGDIATAGIMVEGSGNVAIVSTGSILAQVSGLDSYEEPALVDGIHGHSSGHDGESRIEGDGGDGADGGSVTIQSSGNITLPVGDTTGINAISEGGDGGSGGDSASVGGDGGNGGNGGNGGAITVEASGTINATGPNAFGIGASSEGGDGGDAGFGVEEDGFAGNGGDGGTVNITSSANITVSGSDAIGITGESYGGAAGGGWDGWDGAGGDVTVTNSGTITTDGPGITGIEVSSLGDGTGVLTVNNSGRIINHPVTDPDLLLEEPSLTAGVVFNGGHDNVLNNSGLIDSSLTYDFGGLRFAVGASDGWTTINNTGTIKGSIDLIDLAPVLAESGPKPIDTEKLLSLLDTQGNAFNNAASGEFDAGLFVALGRGNTLTNAGLLVPGSDGVVGDYLDTGMTVLLGDFRQTATGRLALSLDVARNESTSLTVLGTANLAGTIIVNPVTLGSGAIDTKIVSTIMMEETYGAGLPYRGLTNNGVTLLASPALHADLAWRNETPLGDAPPAASDAFTGVWLVSDGIDFSVAGLSSNEQQLAVHLQDIFLQQHPISSDPNTTPSGADDKLFFALLSPMDLAQYKAMLDELTPTAGLDAGGAQLTTASQFADAMMSCRQASGPYAFIREGACSWAQIKQRLTEISTTEDAPGSRTSVSSLSTGVQKRIAGDWFAGIGIGYAHDEISSTSRARSSGDQGLVGAVVKYVPGPFSLALALDAGIGWNDLSRSVALFGETAASSNIQSHVGAKLRAAYLIDAGRWYAKPMVDLNATVLHLGGYTETGLTVGNMTVDDSTSTVLSVSPGLEVGSQLQLANGTLIRPYSRVGVTLFGNNEIATTAHLAGTTGDFEIASSGDRTLLDLTSGLDILSPDGMTVRLSTESHLGSTTRDIAASAKVGWKF